MRVILRDAARLQVRLRPDPGFQVTTSTVAQDFRSPLHTARVAAAPRFSVRKSALPDCSCLYCTEYDSTGRALSAVTREDFFSGTAPPSPPASPVCQPGSDMLPAWQRFENCAGDKQRRSASK